MTIGLLGRAGCCLLVGASLLLSACGGSKDETPSNKNVLIERWSATVGDPVSLDPAHAIYTIPQASISNALFDQLTTYDPATRKVVPMLAESVTSNGDATVWTFRLHANAVWHDGTPVLPSDVKYAWERIAKPETASRAAALMSVIKGYADVRSGKSSDMAGIVADDSARVLTVTLNEPFVDFPGLVTLLPFSPVPAHIVSKIPAGQRWDDQIVIGSGPFKMSEPWRHGRYIRLARFDQYYGGAVGHVAYLDGIEFRIGKDVNASFTEFEAGTAQIAFTPPARYGELKARKDLKILDEAMSATWYLGFNMNDPTVGGPGNVELRHAISLAIDRKAIVDTIYQGGRRIGYAITPEEVPGSNPDVAPVTGRDVAAAKAAFEAWGGAAKLQKPITFLYNTGSSQENVAAVIQANLQEIGIPVTLESVDNAQYVGEILKPSTMMFRQLITFTYPSPDAGLYPLLYSKSAGTNLMHYSNPEVDAALDAARGTMDEAKRQQLYATAEKIALDSYAVIPVFQYKAAAVMAPNLTGVRFMPSGYMDYSNARLQ